MLVTVKNLLEATPIRDVEIFEGDGTEYVIRLKGNGSIWGFVEVSFGRSKKGKKPPITQVRIMRRVEDAPAIADIMILDRGNLMAMAPVEYDGMRFKFAEFGGGTCRVIGPTNLVRSGSSGQWVTFEAKKDGVAHLLVYATFDDAPDKVNVYAGQVLKKKGVTVQLAERKK